jgi:hypothetical protein
MCKFIDWDHPKIVRIHTTLDLCDFEVSVDMAEALKVSPVSLSPLSPTIGPLMKKATWRTFA